MPRLPQKAYELCPSYQADPRSKSFAITPFELRILLFGEAQPDAAPSDLDTVPERLTRFKIRHPASPFRHFDQLCRVIECHFAGQMRLQVFLKELTVPVISEHVGHINPMARLFLCPTAITRTFSGPLPVDQAAFYTSSRFPRQVAPWLSILVRRPSKDCTSTFAFYSP